MTLKYWKGVEKGRKRWVQGKRGKARGRGRDAEVSGRVGGWTSGIGRDAEISGRVGGWTSGMGKDGYLWGC